MGIVICAGRIGGCVERECNRRTGEVKMTRCPDECGKQWRLVQGKSGWKK